MAMTNQKRQEAELPVSKASASRGIKILPVSICRFGTQSLRLDTPMTMNSHYYITITVIYYDYQLQLFFVLLVPLVSLFLLLWSKAASCYNQVPQAESP